MLCAELSCIFCYVLMLLSLKCRYNLGQKCINLILKVGSSNWVFVSDGSSCVNHVPTFKFVIILVLFMLFFSFFMICGVNLLKFLLRYKYTLRSYVEERTFDRQHSTLLIAQLLEAVTHLERHNVAHRDVTEDNIWIEFDPGKNIFHCHHMYS